MSDSSDSHDLVLHRVIDQPREKLWRCWTEPELLRQWFCPAPWSVSAVRIDPRSGGDCHFTMRSPEGEEFPQSGVYLEVVPRERIVFTDAYTTAWQPSGKPFMTAVVEFEDLGDGRTGYTATARHWTAADRDEHKKMGFHEGWGLAADQLAALAATL